MQYRISAKVSAQRKGMMTSSGHEKPGKGIFWETEPEDDTKNSKVRVLKTT